MLYRTQHTTMCAAVNADVRPKNMNANISFISVLFLMATLSASAVSIDFPLKEKIDYCALVAEMRVDEVTKGNSITVPAEWDFLPEWQLRCTFTRIFKSPKSIPSQMTFSVTVTDTNRAYKGGTIIVFCFSTPDSTLLRPFGGQAGIITMGDIYLDPLPSYPKQLTPPRKRRIPYEGLLEEIEKLTKQD